MRKILGAVCMTLGTVLLISALTLFLWNRVESNRAEQSSMEVIPLIKDTIADNEEQATIDPSDFVSSEKKQMTEAEVNGYDYIGYLSIPSQGLELPVMSQWDYDRLKLAPCRYSGTTAEENLVIIAHNYPSHFGNLDQLKFTDSVRFTDMNGAITAYKVVSVDVVPPTSAEEVVAGDFDLALVTCTYSGKTRLVVYCDME